MGAEAAVPGGVTRLQPGWLPVGGGVWGGGVGVRLQHSNSCLPYRVHLTQRIIVNHWAHTAAGETIRAVGKIRQQKANRAYLGN